MRLELEKEMAEEQEAARQRARMAEEVEAARQNAEAERKAADEHGRKLMERIRKREAEEQKATEEDDFWLMISGREGGHKFYITEP